MFTPAGACSLRAAGRPTLVCSTKNHWRAEGEGGTENGNLGGGFKYFLFSPLFGEDSHFD